MPSMVGLFPYVVCIGEALVLLPELPDEPVDQEAALARASLAGAEVNVAAGLAASGLRTSWIGRVGADPFGKFLLSEMRARGIDVAAVEIDRERPTGSYAKEVTVGADGDPQTRMHYRRAGSAASAMESRFLRSAPVAERLSTTKVLHCSGITAALSPSTAKMMEYLIVGDGHEMDICFDVNWREQMWPDGNTDVVAGLAAVSDIVLVGADEAKRVFGTDDIHALHEELPGPRMIVVKRGSAMAECISRDGEITAEPALKVEVVEPVGAGDAFAAGLLAGLARKESVSRCLRRGHLAAAAVLTVEGDSAPPLDDMLLELSLGEWLQVRVSSGRQVALR